MRTLLYLSEGDILRPLDSIGRYRHLSKLTLELALKVRALPLLFTDQTTCGLGECEELYFRRGSPLACGVMGIACSSS